MTAPAISQNARLAMKAALPFDASAEPFEFVRESLVKRQVHIESEGLRGTRSRISENVSLGPYKVSGQIVLHPTPRELARLLPRILGASAGNTCSLAETLPGFQVLIDRQTKVFTYADCKVSRASFLTSRSGPLELALDIEGLTESVAAAGTFPALAFSPGQPYMLQQAAITLAGVGREVRDLVIVVDNGLIVDQFHNTLSRTSLPEGERAVRVKCECPYSADEADLYNLAVEGVAGSAVWTSGGASLAFSFARLQAPDNSPHVPGPSREIPLVLEFVARKNGSSPEVEITNIAA